MIRFNKEMTETLRLNFMVCYYESKHSMVSLQLLFTPKSSKFYKKNFSTKDNYLKKINIVRQLL